LLLLVHVIADLLADRFGRGKGLDQGLPILDFIPRLGV